MTQQTNFNLTREYGASASPGINQYSFFESHQMNITVNNASKDIQPLTIVLYYLFFISKENTVLFGAVEIALWK